MADEAAPFCTNIAPESGPEVQVANGQNIVPYSQATVLMAKELSKKRNMGTYVMTSRLDH